MDIPWLDYFLLLVSGVGAVIWFVNCLVYGFNGPYLGAFIAHAGWCLAVAQRLF